MLPVDKTYYSDRKSSKMPNVCIYLTESASVLVSLEIIFGMVKFGMSESNPECIYNTQVKKIQTFFKQTNSNYIVVVFLCM